MTFHRYTRRISGNQQRGTCQSEAIARNLFEMATLEVPIVSVVIGEGGSGGALAIGVCDRLLMLQYAVYSVISPEGCASILWKSADKKEAAAEAMGITAERLSSLKLVDEVLTEPLGGAHRNPEVMAQSLRAATPAASGYAGKSDASATCGRTRQATGGLRSVHGDQGLTPESILHRVRELAGNPPGRLHCTVAWSGGLDSTVLLHLLVQACRRLPAQLALRAIHVDHGLQPAARDFSRFCRSIAARKWQVPLAVARAEVRLAAGGFGGRGRLATRATRRWPGALHPGETAAGLRSMPMINSRPCCWRCLRGAGPRRSCRHARLLPPSGPRSCCDRAPCR